MDSSNKSITKASTTGKLFQSHIFRWVAVVRQSLVFLWIIHVPCFQRWSLHLHGANFHFVKKFKELHVQRRKMQDMDFLLDDQNWTRKNRQCPSTDSRHTPRPPPSLSFVIFKGRGGTSVCTMIVVIEVTNARDKNPSLWLSRKLLILQNHLASFVSCADC